MNVRDVTGQAVAAIIARWVRAFLISTGTLAGVGTLVATVGLASTAKEQIDKDFNQYTATEVTVTPASNSDPGAIPKNAGILASHVKGVQAAGRYWTVGIGRAGFASVQSATNPVSGALYAADPDTLNVIELHLLEGRRFTSDDDSHGIPSLLMSRSLASQLGIVSISPTSYVFVGGRPFLVMGIYDDSRRQPEVLLGAITSSTVSNSYFGATSAQDPSVLVATVAGSAQVVASQLAVAVRVDDPAALIVSTQLGSTVLRSSIDRSISQILLALSIVAMVIGGLGIANGTLVSVLERVPEIGLLRALGAKRSQVGAQFVIEGTITGTLGGTLGFGLGILAVVGFSRAHGWTPTLDLFTVGLIPLAGTATGLLASIYPAWRATMIPASQALQQ